MYKGHQIPFGMSSSSGSYPGRESGSSHNTPSKPGMDHLTQLEQGYAKRPDHEIRRDLHGRRQDSSRISSALAMGHSDNELLGGNKKPDRG